MEQGSLAASRAHRKRRWSDVDASGALEHANPPNGDDDGKRDAQFLKSAKAGRDLQPSTNLRPYSAAATSVLREFIKSAKAGGDHQPSTNSPATPSAAESVLREFLESQYGAMWTQMTFAGTRGEGVRRSRHGSSTVGGSQTSTGNGSLREAKVTVRCSEYKVGRMGMKTTLVCGGRAIWDRAPGILNRSKTMGAA
jgi:hypothetical protein